MEFIFTSLNKLAVSIERGGEQEFKAEVGQNNLNNLIFISYNCESLSLFILTTGDFDLKNI